MHKEYRRLIPSGSVYAVEVVNGQVVAECGPLHYPEVTPDIIDLEFEPCGPWTDDTEYTVLDDNAIQDCTI